MLKNRFEKLKISLKLQKSKLLGLAISYLIITEVVFRLPYFNVFVFDFQWRITIFYLLLIGWFHPSYKFFIYTSIFFLIFGKFAEVTGVLIYISLLLVVIKLMTMKKTV